MHIRFSVISGHYRPAILAAAAPFLFLAALAVALPAAAAPPLGCENWGAPSFYCPPSGPVCGSSPNYYCPTGTPTACPAYNQPNCASCTCVPDWATACSPPTNGFRDGSGTCTCKPGTTLCTATNTCVTNLSCTSGQAFEPCSNSCVEKYILNSPASVQSGAINITGGAVVGSFKLTATPSNGYILTSDSQGNASWSAPTSGLGGSGTLNYIAKFTPNGTSLGNSGLVDDGSLITLTNEALLLTGTTGTTPTSGAGTRLMWIPSKAAFRAGAATASQLDDANIGNYSFAVGQDNSAAGTHSSAMGWNNTINATAGSYATAFGRSNNIGSTSTASYGFASGYSNSVNASYATALGRSGSATGSYSLTAGYANTASGSASRAMGYYTSATGSYSTALGYYSSSAGQNAFAVGNHAAADGTSSVAMGNYPTASGNYSAAIGYSTQATSDFSFAFGDAVTASGWDSVTIGSSITNSTDSSLAVGFSSTAITVTGGGTSSKLNLYGGLTGTITLLNGSSTASGAGTSSNSLTVVSGTNFDVGNYVEVSSTACVTGVNVCYAKITGKATNVLSISPALSWASGSAVKEVHIPEVGGNNTATPPLANRFGRGYFIDGIVMGNGSTYYTDKGVTTSEGPFVVSSDMEVNGAANVWSGGRYAVPNGRMAGGSLTIGNINANFGNGSGWNSNTAGLMLEAADDTEIAVHDSGTRLASLMLYDGSANTVTIGRDMGWGALAKLNVNGKLAMGGNDVIDANGGWHRSYGSTGWYNGTYGGGWYMTDSTWIRAYNSKSVWVDSVLGTNGGLTSGYSGTAPPAGGAIIAGNVGIGTSSPSMSLDVTKASLWSSPAIGGSNGASDWAYLHVSTGDDSIIWNSGESMRFGTETSKGAGYTEHARINSSGIEAPKFTDKNNTAYYVDPAGASNMNSITLAGDITMANTLHISQEREVALYNGADGGNYIWSATGGYLPDNGRTICFLTFVELRDVDSASEDARCYIGLLYGNWAIWGLTEDDSDAICRGRCLYWDR